MWCICQNCQTEIQHGFDIDSIPELDSCFQLFCPECGSDQIFKYKKTRKVLAEQRRIEEEEKLKNKIRGLAESYGFKYNFIFQSVTVTTPCSSWRFDYHKKIIHLMHESTYKYNLLTGNEAFWHRQLDQKMTIEEVFKYIDNHDKAAMRRKK